MCWVVVKILSCSAKELLAIFAIRGLVNGEVWVVASYVGKGIKDNFTLYKKASRTFPGTSLSFRVINEKPKVLFLCN